MLARDSREKRDRRDVQILILRVSLFSPVLHVSLAFSHRDFFTPTRSQYSMSLHLLQNGETGWQRFCP